jgi:hypothetical protein
MTQQPEIVLSKKARQKLFELDRAERELFMERLIPAMLMGERGVHSIRGVDDRYRVTNVLGYTVLFREIDKLEAERYNIDKGYMIASIAPHLSPRDDAFE